MSSPQGPVAGDDLPSVQWYPGHIAKARRLLQERLAVVDLVVEVADARIPASSRSADARQLIGAKPTILVLAKPDLAEPEATEAWARELGAIPVDCRTGEGMGRVKRRLAELKAQVDQRMKARGRLPRPARVMVVGLPNVGKSSFINRLVGRRKAPTGARPGITRAPGWIRLGGELELLDTPGLIPPRLDDRLVALKLALVGAVPDEAYDPIDVARAALRLVADRYPGLLARYANRPESGTFAGPDGLELLASQRGWLAPGGPDLPRAARSFLSDLRTGAPGRVTWERIAEEVPRGPSE